MNHNKINREGRCSYRFGSHWDEFRRTSLSGIDHNSLYNCSTIVTLPPSLTEVGDGYLSYCASVNKTNKQKQKFSVSLSSLFFWSELVLYVSLFFFKNIPLAYQELCYVFLVLNVHTISFNLFG